MRCERRLISAGFQGGAKRSTGRGEDPCEWSNLFVFDFSHFSRVQLEGYDKYTPGWLWVKTRRPFSRVELTFRQYVNHVNQVFFFHVFPVLTHCLIGQKKKQSTSNLPAQIRLHWTHLFAEPAE